MEISSSGKLAAQFRDFQDGSDSQITLTTHFPEFYNIRCCKTENNNRISSHRIYLGTKQAKELGMLDEHMGTVALLAPIVANI